MTNEEHREKLEELNEHCYEAIDCVEVLSPQHQMVWTDSEPGFPWEVIFRRKDSKIQDELETLREAADSDIISLLAERSNLREALECDEYLIDCLTDIVDNVVDRWHQGDSQESLSEFLGVDAVRFKRFVESRRPKPYVVTTRPNKTEEIFGFHIRGEEIGISVGEHVEDHEYMSPQEAKELARQIQAAARYVELRKAGKV